MKNGSRRFLAGLALAVSMLPLMGLDCGGQAGTHETPTPSPVSPSEAVCNAIAGGRGPCESNNRCAFNDKYKAGGGKCVQKGGTFDGKAPLNCEDRTPGACSDPGASCQVKGDTCSPVEEKKRQPLTCRDIIDPDGCPNDEVTFVTVGSGKNVEVCRQRASYDKNKPYNSISNTPCEIAKPGTPVTGCKPAEDADLKESLQLACLGLDAGKGECSGDNILFRGDLFSTPPGSDALLCAANAGTGNCEAQVAWFKTIANGNKLCGKDISSYPKEWIRVGTTLKHAITAKVCADISLSANDKPAGAPAPIKISGFCIPK
jgi:hypothetical protein